MSPESAPNQCVNMEYNNEHHNLHSNNSISTSNNSSVLTLTSPYVKSKNEEGCLLFNPIHNNIKFSGVSKAQSIAVRFERYIMKSWIKLLSNKTWNHVIL